MVMLMVPVPEGVVPVRGGMDPAGGSNYVRGKALCLPPPLLKILWQTPSIDRLAFCIFYKKRKIKTLGQDQAVLRLGHHLSNEVGLLHPLLLQSTKKIFGFSLRYCYEQSP
jgi:hypothetical protein